MKINWQKKKSATLKWLGAGPGFLLYLIFIQEMKVFENGVAQGLLLCLIFIAMPAVAVFLIYWPKAQTRESDSQKEGND